MHVEYIPLLGSPDTLIRDHLAFHVHSLVVCVYTRSKSRVRLINKRFQLLFCKFIQEVDDFARVRSLSKDFTYQCVKRDVYRIGILCNNIVYILCFKYLVKVYVECLLYPSYGQLTSGGDSGCNHQVIVSKPVVTNRTISGVQ